MTAVKRQSVAEGRAQADLLRPIGVRRSSASPTVVIPNPTHEQLLVLARERARYREDPERALRTVRGVIYPSGVLVIEFRIYPSSRPYMYRSLALNGKAMYSAHVQDYLWNRDNWTVVRGANGRKPVGKRNLLPWVAKRLLIGEITAREAAEY